MISCSSNICWKPDRYVVRELFELKNPTLSENFLLLAPRFMYHVFFNGLCCLLLAWCRRHQFLTTSYSGDYFVSAIAGYFEDRRPASNMDPYVVTSMIAETTILWKPTWSIPLFSARRDFPLDLSAAVRGMRFWGAFSAMGLQLFSLGSRGLYWAENPDAGVHWSLLLV